MAAVQTPAQQLEWLKSNAADFDPAVKAVVDGFDESTADFMVAAIFAQQHQQLEAVLAARSEAEKQQAAAETLFEETLKGIEVDVEGNTWGFKPQNKSKPEGRWLVDAKYIPYLIKQLQVLNETTLEASKPKKGKKASGTRDRVNADDCIQWVINTQEDAELEYAGKWAVKADFEIKATNLATMKTYKVGDADPRPENKGETLTQPLMKRRWYALTRNMSIFDKDDANRCKGSVAWKSGRVSPWAKKQGFSGSAMAQCGEKAVIGGFCKGCKVDFFDKSSVYKKSGIAYCEGWGECVKC